MLVWLCPNYSSIEKTLFLVQYFAAFAAPYLVAS